MAISNQEAHSNPSSADGFDPAVLVTRKPSALPDIYAYIVGQQRASPSEIQADVGVSKSVTHTNIRKLRDTGLVEKIERGSYRPAGIAIDPRTVRALGSIRSRRQFEICRWAVDRSEFDVCDIRSHVEMARSNAREVACKLVESGFLDSRRVAFEKSRKRYRLTEKGTRALAGIEVDAYRDWGWRETVGHSTGLDGTDFYTAYEIEDAHYLAEAGEEWLHPREVARQFGRNRKKTRRRFAKMAERGLLEAAAEPEKLLFSPTARAHALVDDLALYSIARSLDVDVYSVARGQSVTEPFTPDELYAALVGNATEISIGALNGVRNALKRADLLEGNPQTGYTFTIGSLRPLDHAV